VSTPATPSVQPVIMPDAEDSQIDSIFPWLASTPQHFGPFRSPERRARWSVWAVASVAALHAVNVALIVLSGGDRTALDPEGTTFVGVLLALIGVGLPVMFLASGVAVISWQRTVIRNTRYFGCEKPHPGPTLAAFSWIIPFANLYYPFKSVQEAAQYGAEDRRDIRGELAGWWATWIVGLGIKRVAQSMISVGADGDLSSYLVIDAVGSACLVASGILFIRIIREVTARHIRRHRELDAAEVFA
jgi:hypothetical protein